MPGEERAVAAQDHALALMQVGAGHVDTPDRVQQTVLLERGGLGLEHALELGLGEG